MDELTREQLLAENQQLREELTALRGKLVQTQKLSSVGALASSITHEFNNILTTIINYGKMGMRHKDEATRTKALDKIVMAGQRAAKITTGMLSYARNRGDHREAQSLRQLVDDVLVLVEKDMQVHRVHVETQFIGDAYAILNAGQIQQVLLNLIINARQAMNEGGTLWVSVRTNQQEELAELSVRDSGCGIPADKLQHIFDPYFSTKQVDAGGQGGTGLGLALCKDIIDAHQGRIRVESAIGKGTCFTLRFPLVAAPTFRTTAAAS